MKILFVSRTIYPEIKGGGEISAFYIAKSILPHAQVIVCTLSEKINLPIIEEKEGLKIYRFPWKKLKYFPRISNLEYCYWQIYQAIKEVIKKEKPDIIHFLNFSSIAPLALFFKKYPKFVTCNGPWFCNFGGYHEGKSCYKCTFKDKIFFSFKKWRMKAIPFLLYTEYSNFLLKKSLMKCTKILPVSKAMEKMLLANHIPQNKLSIIHNPIEIKKKEKTNLKKELNINNEKVLLYAGRLAEDKGVQYVLESLTNIKNVVYIIAGKGPFEEELRKIVYELKIENKVRFVGFVDQSQLREYYSIADIMIYTGMVYEALPRMLLEAISYGLPIITSNIGGNSEVVDDKQNGIIITHNSPKEIILAINSILNNKTIYLKMCQKSLNKTYKSFEIKVIGNQLLYEYKKEIKT